MVSPISYPPSHDDLVNKALTYLKETHPQDYDGMSTQRRDKYAEEAANRAEGCARTLIVQGKSESEARNTEDFVSGRGQGFALVRLKTKEEAELLKEQMNGQFFRGRNIRISF